MREEDAAVMVWPPYSRDIRSRAAEEALGGSGIPVFLSHSPIESPETQAELESLNKIAATAGWRQALSEVYGTNTGLLRYVLSDSRSSYLALLPVDGKSRVLEIGPGLGQFTCALAQHVEQVCALEVVKGQAVFAQMRCRQMGLANVSVACGGDDCMLPYASDVFDGVVINLVLEWCGSRSRDVQQQCMQTRLLAEAHRVLKPGGFAFVNTKNRYALRYLLGKRDEHAGYMRFGNALPRWLMHLLLGRKHASGRLYSYPELRRMLRDAGFATVDGYWAAPEMRYPEKWISSTSAAIKAARFDGSWRQGEGRLEDAIMRAVPACFVPHVARGLTFLARKASCGK